MTGFTIQKVERPYARIYSDGSASWYETLEDALAPGLDFVTIAKALTITAHVEPVEKEPFKDRIDAWFQQFRHRLTQDMVETMESLLES